MPNTLDALKVQRDRLQRELDAMGSPGGSSLQPSDYFSPEGRRGLMRTETPEETEWRDLQVEKKYLGLDAERRAELSRALDTSDRRYNDTMKDIAAQELLRGQLGFRRGLETELEGVRRGLDIAPTDELKERRRALESYIQGKEYKPMEPARGLQISPGPQEGGFFYTDAKGATRYITPPKPEKKEMDYIQSATVKAFQDALGKHYAGIEPLEPPRVAEMEGYLKAMGGLMGKGVEPGGMGLTMPGAQETPTDKVFPGNIRTVSQAVAYLQSTGMSEQQAKDWLRRQK